MSKGGYDSGSEAHSMESLNSVNDNMIQHVSIQEQSYFVLNLIAYNSRIFFRKTTVGTTMTLFHKIFALWIDFIGEF